MAQSIVEVNRRKEKKCCESAQDNEKGMVVCSNIADIHHSGLIRSVSGVSLCKPDDKQRYDGGSAKNGTQAQCRPNPMPPGSGTGMMSRLLCLQCQAIIKNLLACVSCVA